MATSREIDLPRPALVETLPLTVDPLVEFHPGPCGPSYFSRVSSSEPKFRARTTERSQLATVPARIVTHCPGGRSRRDGRVVSYAWGRRANRLLRWRREKGGSI
jgi:hypothetical protein